MSDPAFDIEQPEALEAYLREAGRIAGGSPRMRVLAGGVSNRTVLIEPPGSAAFVVKQALPKLRVAVDWFSDPARICREALGLRWLTELAPMGTTPTLLWEDPDHYLLAMSAVPEPHANWKAHLFAGGLESAHVEQFGHLLGTIHQRSSERRTELESLFADRTFFETLRLEPYYLYSAGQEPRAAAFLHALVTETLSRRDALVHGDYSPKNILIHQDKLILLDHEVVHFGEPAFDLGFGLTHLLSKAHHFPTQREEFLAAARLFWRTYDECLGDVPWRDGLEARAVRHTLGCLLARVMGRSPLEYLTPAEKSRQRERTLELMQTPPASVDALTASLW